MEKRKQIRIINFSFILVYTVLIIGLFAYKFLVRPNYNIELYSYFSYLVYIFGIYCWIMYAIIKILKLKDKSLTKFLVYAVVCSFIFVLNMTIW